MNKSCRSASEHEWIGIFEWMLINMDPCHVIWNIKIQHLITVWKWAAPQLEPRWMKTCPFEIDKILFRINLVPNWMDPINKVSTFGWGIWSKSIDWMQMIANDRCMFIGFKTGKTSNNACCQSVFVSWYLCIFFSRIFFQRNFVNNCFLLKYVDRTCLQ